MKFTLFLLLSVCALAAHGRQITSLELTPEARGPILNSIKDVFERAVKYVTDAVNNVVTKGKALLDYVKANIGTIVSDGMKKAWEIAQTIAKLAYKGVVAKVCVKPYQEEISQLLNEMQAALDQCSAESMAAVQELQNEIMTAVARVQEYAAELYTLVKNCFDADGKFINGALCVGKNVIEIHDKVMKAYNVANTAITNAQERVPQIIEQQQQCSDAAKEQPMAELQKILASVQTCIAENS